MWLWTILLSPVQINYCYRVIRNFRVLLTVDSIFWFRCVLMTFLPCFGNSKISILSHHTEITFECFLHNAWAPSDLMYRPLKRSECPRKRNGIWTFKRKYLHKTSSMKLMRQLILKLTDMKTLKGLHCYLSVYCLNFVLEQEESGFRSQRH